MDLKKCRQQLHEIAELSKKEFKTKEYIINKLEEYGCSIEEILETGVIAFFNFGKEKTLAFRSDMDALPIAEKKQEGCSKTKGVMHACGHDGHMAMLLGLADYLDKHKANYNVVLIFEPAEETTGGAKDIVESKMLEKYSINEIYGYHLWPNIPFGKIAFKAETMMAKSSEIDIEITGRSAHCAKFYEGIDALEIASKFLVDAYNLSLDEEFLLRFGYMQSGTVRNAVSAKTILKGSLRALSKETYEYLKDYLSDLKDKYVQTTKCKIDIKINDGYEMVSNDISLYEKAKKLFPNFMELEKPSMTTEDFSFFQKRYPGLFMFLGIGETKPLHSDEFDFNEEILEIGLEGYIKILSS